MGIRRIFVRISETCQKNLGHFLCEYFLMKTVMPDLQKTPFFSNKRTLASTFTRFSGILPTFSGILPKFSTNLNFWGCTCTTAFYTSDCSRLLQQPSACNHAYLKSFYFNTRQNNIQDFTIWGVIAIFQSVISTPKNGFKKHWLSTPSNSTENLWMHLTALVKLLVNPKNKKLLVAYFLSLAQC